MAPTSPGNLVKSPMADPAGGPRRSVGNTSECGWSEGDGGAW